MPDASVQNRPDGEYAAILPSFVSWYYAEHPVRIIRTYGSFAVAFRESFSILFLLKTLFEPWKRIKDTYPSKGFNAQAILETLFLNLTTRGIGAFIRLCAIIAGLAIQIVLLAGFIVWLAVWLLFPFIVAVGIPILFIRSFL